MNKENNKKIEEILTSLDGSKRASAPDFLYTRIKARMLSQLEANEGGNRFFKLRTLRPAYALVLLVLIIAINATILLKSGNSAQSNENTDEYTQTIASEYNINENTILFDLNTEK